MAAEIQTSYITAKTLYAIVRNATGSVWQTTTNTFVAYATANLANYTIALTEQGSASCYYTGTFPAALAGIYSVSVYVRAGGSAAESDGPAIAVGDVGWNGSIVVPIAALYQRFFGKVHRDKVGNTIKVYQSDSSTVMTTQAVTSTSTDDDVGVAT